MSEHDKAVNSTDAAEQTTDAAVDPVALAESLEGLSDEQLRQVLAESRITIKPGGEVVIENLTADMLGVAYELDPDNPGIQCRVDALEEGEESEEAS